MSVPKLFDPRLMNFRPLLGGGIGKSIRRDEFFRRLETIDHRAFLTGVNHSNADDLIPRRNFELHFRSVTTIWIKFRSPTKTSCRSKSAPNFENDPTCIFPQKSWRFPDWRIGKRQILFSEPRNAPRVRDYSQVTTRHLLSRLEFISTPHRVYRNLKKARVR